METLETILHFDDCKSLTDIEKRLDEISSILLFELEILDKKSGMIYRVTDVELFLDFPDIEIIEPAILRHPLQQQRGKWFLHKKQPSNTYPVQNFTGLDITCGGSNYFASLKIDGLEIVGVDYPESYNLIEAKDRIVVEGMARSIKAIVSGKKTSVPKGNWKEREIEYLDQIDGEDIFTGSVLVLRRSQEPLLEEDLRRDIRESVQSLECKSFSLSDRELAKKRVFKRRSYLSAQNPKNERIPTKRLKIQNILKNVS